MKKPNTAVSLFKRSDQIFCGKVFINCFTLLPKFNGLKMVDQSAFHF